MGFATGLLPAGQSQTLASAIGDNLTNGGFGAAPPPPPPLPPAAHAPSVADASVAQTADAARKRAQQAAGKGNSSTNLTGASGTGSMQVSTGKAQLLGDTAS